MARHLIPALFAAILAACGSKETVTQGQGEAEAGPLRYEATFMPDFFDCLRVEGGTVVAAHRGGPKPGFPENALETLKETFARSTPVMEIDVSESRDGVLFLMHDRSLTRTTNGSGAVADTDWADIAKLSLVDRDGLVTGFAPPTLAEALRWAVEAGAILELDRKENTSFRKIIAEVREASAENNVIIITYNDDQAAEVARLAPDLMMTASARSVEDVETLVGLGVDPARLIAWTGTREPDATAWNVMAGEGIEAAFGTLGRPGDRLDDSYTAEDFTRLARTGVRLIATDRPDDVARDLTADDIAFRACNR